MKRIKVLTLLFLLGVVCTSCEKEKKDWNRVYGFSAADIAGSYTYSNVTDAFSGLMESSTAYLCSDAEVTVSPSSGSTANIKVLCPDHQFQKDFSGRLNLGPNSFLVTMYSNWSGLKRYGLSADVWKNAQEDLRLRGFVTEDHYNKQYNVETGIYDTVFDYSVKYYFDVVKN